MLEVKLQDANIAPSIIYFRDRLKIPFSYQVVKKTGLDILKDGVRIISADRFLKALV